jgi:hypothetical protein
VAPEKRWPIRASRPEGARLVGLASCAGDLRAPR